MSTIYTRSDFLLEAPTIKTLSQPPMKCSPLAGENKTYACLTATYTELFGKLGVTVTHSFSKGTEKCTFLRVFFFSVIDFNTLGCPKASRVAIVQQDFVRIIKILTN